MKKIFLAIMTGLSVMPCSCGSTDYVNFYNYDGELLWQTPYYEDMVLQYDGSTPTKEKDDIYEYTFSGWNHDLSEVSMYRNFYARYDKDFRTFNVTFNNYDGTRLKVVSAKYGSNVAGQAPASPVREGVGRTRYRFSGWDGIDITYVTSDGTTTAQYETIRCFEVTFLDYDGSLLKKEYIEPGGYSSYVLNSCREADEDHYYVFSNWSESVTNVLCDMTVKAEYKLVNAYTVTFQNYDGTVLGTSKGPEGFTAIYKGNTPQRDSKLTDYYRYTYFFSGWDKNLTNVRSSFTTTAKFSESSVNYKYAGTVEKMKNWVYEKGAYSDGTRGYVFGIDSSGGYNYYATAQIANSNGILDINMIQAKVNTSGSILAYTHLYLDDYWNNGQFDFRYGFVKKDSSGNTTQDDEGSGEIHGPTFSSSATLEFSSYHGDMADTVAATMARSLISLSLDKLAKSSTWDMMALGFNNYNY